MKKWLYQNKEISLIEDLPQETFGFIYITTHIPSGVSYIGKKSLYHNIKRKLTKKELAEQTGRGRKPTTQVVQKESDWKTYYGSTKQIVTLIKEGKQDEFERHILICAYTKKQLTYYEIKYQMIYEVLEKPDKFYNDNILGKFFTGDFAS